MITCIRDSSRFLQTIENLLRDGHPVSFRAEGWSMHPTIRDGEVITVAPLGRSRVHIGEVLLYRRGDTPIAHRVVRLDSHSGRSTMLVLQGDAVPYRDRPVTPEQVLGRVRTVQRGGRRVRLGLLSLSWLRARARRIHRHLTA
jgi:signal peptidase I